MTYNPDIHHRRSIRLREFDYSSIGGYFVTTCVQNRECLFGDVMDGVMVLNDAGRLVESVWNGLAERFPSIELDAFVAMPNHIHFIVNIALPTEIDGADQGRRAKAAPLRWTGSWAHSNRFQRRRLTVFCRAPANLSGNVIITNGLSEMKRSCTLSGITSYTIP